MQTFGLAKLKETAEPTPSFYPRAFEDSLFLSFSFSLFLSFFLGTSQCSAKERSTRRGTGGPVPGQGPALPNAGWRSPQPAPDAEGPPPPNFPLGWGKGTIFFWGDGRAPPKRLVSVWFYFNYHGHRLFPKGGTLGKTGISSLTPVAGLHTAWDRGKRAVSGPHSGMSASYRQKWPGKVPTLALFLSSVNMSPCGVQGIPKADASMCTPLRNSMEATKGRVAPHSTRASCLCARGAFV